MTNSEKKNLDEGEEDSDKNDRPLSREGWIMFLGDKINEYYMTKGVFMTICFACALAVFSGLVAFTIAKMDGESMLYVLFIFVIVFIAIALLIVGHIETKIKPIEWIREGIIFEKEGFKTYDEIQKQCENAGVILKRKNKRNYLYLVILAVGDLAFGRKRTKIRYWSKKLNGNVILLIGNHDKEYLDSVPHADRCVLSCKGGKILLIHDPEKVREWDGWVIHGHEHNNKPEKYPFINGKNKTLNVSVELINYTPISID